MSTQADLAWLSLVARGGLNPTFSITEDGDLGLFFSDDGPALARGDTAEEVLSEAHREWHKGELPEQRTDCACRVMDDEGADISHYGTTDVASVPSAGETPT